MIGMDGYSWSPTIAISSTSSGHSLLGIGAKLGLAEGAGLVVGAAVGSFVSVGGERPLGAGVIAGSLQIPTEAMAPIPLKRTVIFVTSS